MAASTSSSSLGPQETEQYGSSSGGNLASKKEQEKQECTLAIFCTGDHAQLPAERQEAYLQTAQLGLRKISIKTQGWILNFPYKNIKLGKYQGNPVLIIV